MDKDYFVKKVEFLCLAKVIKPTNACKECGVGTSFLPDIKRGRVPSVDKFEKLAHYLETIVSDLLGEVGPKNLAIQDQPYLVMQYNQLSPESQDKVRTFINFLAVQEDIEKNKSAQVGHFRNTERNFSAVI